MSLPSIKTLCEIKDVTPDVARQIRAIMAGPSRVCDGDACACRRPFSDCPTRLKRIDRLIGTHGVEFISRGYNAKSPAIWYCNAGDSYAVTVLQINGQFRVGTWGAIVERGSYD